MPTNQIPATQLIDENHVHSPAKHPKIHFHQTNPANLIQYKQHHPATTPGFPRVFHLKNNPFAGFSHPNPGTRTQSRPDIPSLDAHTPKMLKYSFA